MDTKQREICEKLRKMDSSEAAEWLFENLPGDGCIYISKRTWKKEDQLRLAEHFLGRLPHASGRCYESLLSIMALQKFVEVVKKNLPKNNSDKDLLKYYLYPVLERCSETEKDRSAIESLKSIMS